MKSSSERDVVNMDLNQLNEDKRNTSLWNGAQRGGLSLMKTPINMSNEEKKERLSLLGGR